MEISLKRKSVQTTVNVKAFLFAKMDFLTHRNLTFVKGCTPTSGRLGRIKVELVRNMTRLTKAEYITIPFVLDSSQQKLYQRTSMFGKSAQNATVVRCSRL